jgi:hypothetical protein
VLYVRPHYEAARLTPWFSARPDCAFSLRSDENLNRVVGVAGHFAAGSGDNQEASFPQIPPRRPVLLLPYNGRTARGSRFIQVGHALCPINESGSFNTRGLAIPIFAPTVRRIARTTKQRE